MHVVIKRKDMFDTTEYVGVKNIAFNAGVYTLTLSDNTTANYAKADYYLFLIVE